MIIRLLLLLTLLFSNSIATQNNNRVFQPKDFIKEKKWVESILANDQFSWTNEKTAIFDVYYLSDEWNSSRVNSVIAEMTNAYTRNSELLHAINYQERITIFLVGEKTDVGALTGLSVTGVALLPENAVMLSNSTFATTPQILQHELMHVQSFNLWGMPYDYALLEGLATLAYGTTPCEYEFNAVLNYLKSSDTLPTIENLVNNFFNCGEVIGYISSASFINFIIEDYDIEDVKTMWEIGIYNWIEQKEIDIKQLEATWNSVIGEAQPINENNWESLNNYCE